MIQRLDEAFRKKNDGDFLQALKELRFLEKSSTNPRDTAFLRLYQASCLTDLGQVEEARKLMKQVDKSLLTPSKQLDYEYEMARIERASGQPKKALAEVRKGLEFLSLMSNRHEAETMERALGTLHAILLAELGRCDEAIPLLKEVYVNDEGWAEATLLIGDCHYKAKRYLDALESYLKLAGAPQKVDEIFRNDAMRNAGIVYQKLSEYSKAIECLTKVKDAYDNYPELKSELMDAIAEAHSRVKRVRDPNETSRPN